MTAKRISIIAACFLVLIGTFSAGMLSAFKSWGPWLIVNDARVLWKSYSLTGRFLRPNTYFRRDDTTSNEAYVVSDPARIMPGYVLISRFHPEKQSFVADLMDTNGNAVFSWPIDYSLVVEGGSPGEFVHGAVVMRDGSIIADFDDGHAIARLDTCGQPIWVRDDNTYHHLIERDGEDIWVWRGESDGAPEQEMVRLDVETGEVKETVALLADLIEHSTDPKIRLTIPKGFTYDASWPDPTKIDLFHANDVEPLSAEMASAFPQFSAGDLLFSLRNPSALAVASRQSHKILWLQYGPWLQQHDPDFEADGTITVFSNNPDRRRSHMMRVDPQTGATTFVFEDDGPVMYTRIMGTHQRLPNGNWLISVPQQGQVIEVTDSGKPVREFGNIIDAKFSSLITYAEFLPENFFDKMPTCDGTN